MAKRQSPPRVTVAQAAEGLLLAAEGGMRPGIMETPTRFAAAWEFLTSGYGVNPASVLKEFEDGGEHYDELVVVRNIPVQSLCEHHMLPFFGHCHIAYIPNGKVLGLSKFARVLEVFMRRLQVQERLTQQVAQCLHAHLNPKGVGVIIECRHMCMEMRGVRTIGSVTTTSALHGVIKHEPQVRAEFLALKTGRV